MDWDRWMDEHLAKLALYARQQTRTDSDADDVLQDAIIAAWKRRPDQCPDLPLVYSYIRRRAIDLGRKLKTREDFASSKDVQLTSTETDFEKRDDEKLLHQAISKLPPNLGEAIVLHLWGGLTFQEMGDVLSISPNTASSRYRLALEKLRHNTQSQLR